MKMEKGITLISLVITIILLTILAGVGISTGIDSIAKSNVLKFKSDMRVIHTRVSELVEEEVLSIEQLNALGQPVPNVATTALNGKNPADYRYFNKMGLERLGISGIDREIIINFSTKDVLDINGIEIDGEMVYDLPEWKDISFNDNNNQSPTFSLSKKNYGLNAIILIENLQYGENTGRGSISYCFNDGIWHDIQSTEISVTTTGTYKVRVTNTAKNSTEHTINVTVANKPQLEEGMIPIVYDSTLSKWKTIGENSGTWYDYDPTENKWASVVVQENLTINNDGTIDSINENNIKLWIPRYMFYVTNNANELQVKYLKGTTNIATDNTNEQTSELLRYGLWAIPDTFSESGYPLTGVWITKPSETTTIVGIIGIDLEEEKNLTIDIYADNHAQIEKVEGMGGISLNVYSDENCTNLVRTISSTQDYLPIGKYYIKIQGNIQGFLHREETIEREIIGNGSNTWKFLFISGDDASTSGYINLYFDFYNSISNKEIEPEELMESINNIYIDIYYDSECTNLYGTVHCNSTQPYFTTRISSINNCYAKIDGAPNGYAANTNIYPITNNKTIIYFTPGETPVINRTPTPTPTSMPPMITPTPTPTSMPPMITPTPTTTTVPPPPG